MQRIDAWVDAWVMLVEMHSLRAQSRARTTRQHRVQLQETTMIATRTLTDSSIFSRPFPALSGRTLGILDRLGANDGPVRLAPGEEPGLGQQLPVAYGVSYETAQDRAVLVVDGT